MDVDSRQLIDAQFDRAVEIVQGLPKTGPIQTGYEDKLNMYRYDTLDLLYEPVLIPRPSACTSKVIERVLLRPAHPVCLTPASCVMRRSDRRQCSRLPSKRLGYAGEGEVVSASTYLPQTHNHMLPPL